MNFVHNSHTSNVPIYKFQDRGSLDFSSGEPDQSFLTILRALEVRTVSYREYVIFLDFK